MSNWKPEKITIALFDKAQRRDGFEYLGLGLHQLIGAWPEMNWKPTWGLYHLGSGHVIVSIKAEDAEVFSIATEIAEAGDWTFDGPDGWRNQFPDIWEKLALIQHSYPDKIGTWQTEVNAELAFEILMRREDAQARKISRRKRKPT